VLEEIDKPWVSTPATPGPGTTCEKIDFKKAKATKSGSVTYVTPEAKVPTEFGLDNTVAKFASATAASNFVSQIRRNVDGCEKSVSNAKVESTGSISSGAIRGESWVATYDTIDGKKVRFRIGVAGLGTRAVYLLFPVLPKLDISDAAFEQTLTRAAERSVTYN
jgi:hypothetical protein